MTPRIHAYSWSACIEDSLLEQICHVLHPKLLELTVVLQHRRKALEYFRIEVVLSQHVIDHSFARHQTVDILLLYLEQLDFSLSELLQLLDCLKLRLKRTLFLETAH